MARPCSWSAAATISEADAEPPLTSTTTGSSGSVATPSPVELVLANVVVGRLLREDQPVVDELAGDLLRRVDVAAGVVAQVEDDLVGALVEELGEARRRTGRRPVREKPLRRDVADVAVDHPRLDLLEDDLGARDRHVERLAVVALDREGDVGARLAADLA